MKNSTSGFLVGLLAGAAVGAALGILFAPEKGSVTRKKIRNKAEKIKDDFDEKFEDVKTYVNDAIGDLKAKVSKSKEKEA
jgi:gas vesicle protein